MAAPVTPCRIQRPNSLPASRAAKIVDHPTEMARETFQAHGLGGPIRIAQVEAVGFDGYFNRSSVPAR